MNSFQTKNKTGLLTGLVFLWAIMRKHLFLVEVADNLIKFLSLLISLNRTVCDI